MTLSPKTAPVVGWILLGPYLSSKSERQHFPPYSLLALPHKAAARRAHQRRHSALPVVVKRSTQRLRQPPRFLKAKEAAYVMYRRDYRISS